ncbi:MAG: ELWxxDGT repeat protein, partial [Cyanobacteria bacterium P01_D01_bin.116]
MNKNLTASLIKDIEPGAESSNPGFIGDVNGNLLFTTFNPPVNGLTTQLWKTDGSEAGTVLVSDFGNNSFPPSSVAIIDNAVYFLLNTSFTSLSLFRSDGTESGTITVDGANLRLGESINNLTAVGDSLFYTATTGSSSLLRERLFRIDNNISEPVLIQPESGGGIPSDLIGVGNTLFFSDSFELVDGSPDIELWKSDGTDAGTVLVKDINPNDSSNPDLFADVNGTLFFSAEDGTNGRELWKSDGTEAGTVLIKDINPGSDSSISRTPFTAPMSNSGSKFADVNGTFYFVADDGTNGNELWKSDGTNSGTVLVKDISLGSEGSNLDNLTNVNSTLFFTVNDGSNGTELWKSDGTESGTVLVKDINGDENSSNPNNLTNLDGILYFTADDGTNGVELWKSDGTTDGTVLVDDINSGSASSDPGGLTVFSDELYFSADDGINGRELWGLTEGGTKPNQDLILGGDSNDILEGKERDNIIDGLQGDDTLTGGAGKDKFVLSDDFGSDVITDFSLGEDEIVNATSRIVLTVAAIGDAVNVAFSNTGDVLRVNFNSNEQSELENYLLNLDS